MNNPDKVKETLFFKTDQEGIVSNADNFKFQNEVEKKGSGKQLIEILNLLRR